MAVTGSDDERTTAEDEARIARLYRLGSVEEPPARIDAVIAAAARRPVGLSSRRRSEPWWQIWRVPFAVAAVAVVSVSLVTLMMEEGGERLTTVPESVPPVVAERDAARRSEPPRETAPSTAEVPTREHRSQSQEAAPKKAALSDERKDDTTSAASRREAVVAQEAQRGTPDTSAKTLQKAPMVEAPQPMQEGANSNVAGAVSAPRAKLESPMPDAFPAAADRAAPPPAASPKPAPTSRPSVGLRGLASESAEFARPSPEVARHIVQLENQPPSAWIERITALRKEGSLAEADGLVVEFKRRFPNEPLPPSLQ